MKYTIIISLLLPLSLLAQKEEVNAGISDYNKEKYQEALDHFDKALKQKEELSGKNLTKAYYYRAKSRLGLLQAAGKQEGQQQDATLLAYEDLQQARQHDQQQKFSRLIAIEELVLYNSFLRSAAEALQLQRANLMPGDKAVSYLEKALTIRKNDYLPYDLFAQLQLLQQDSAAALQNSILATEKYVQYPPEQPDFRIGYAFYRNAMLEYFMNTDLDKALKNLQYGLQLLQLEYTKLAALKTAQPALYDQQNEQYLMTSKDLKDYELELYLQSPDRKEEALQHFAQAVSENPGDYFLMVKYADLMAQVSPYRALDIYQQAILVNPQLELGRYKLGELYQQMVASEEGNQTDALLKQAMIEFEKAHQANPANAATIRAILHIATTLNDDEKKRQYEQKAMELNEQ